MRNPSQSAPLHSENLTSFSERQSHYKQMLVRRLLDSNEVNLSDWNRVVLWNFDGTIDISPTIERGLLQQKQTENGNATCQLHQRRNCLGLQTIDYSPLTQKRYQMIQMNQMFIMPNIFINRFNFCKSKKNHSSYYNHYLITIVLIWVYCDWVNYRI